MAKTKTNKKGSGTKVKEPVYKKSRAKLSTIKPLKHKERVLKIVVGCKGSGKTVETKGSIKKYHKKFPKEKILILDFYNEYSEYKALDVNDIIKYNNSIKTEPRRIVCDLKTAHKQIEQVMFHFRGCLLVIEQNPFIDNIKQEHLLMGLVASNRTKDIDIILHYSSIRQVPIKVYQNASFFRVHRNIEQIDLRKYLETHHSTALWVALDIQSNQLTNYNCIHVNMNTEKIFGASYNQLYYSSVSYFSDKIHELAKRLKGEGNYGKN